jgi:serine acetyltransferase
VAEFVDSGFDSLCARGQGLPKRPARQASRHQHLIDAVSHVLRSASACACRVSTRLDRSACAIARINAIVRRAVIDPAAEIGPGLYIPHTTGVLFQGAAGANLSLYTFAAVTPRKPMPFSGGGGKFCPRIGNDVSIGTRAVMFGPVLVGDRSHVADRRNVRTGQEQVQMPEGGFFATESGACVPESVHS